MGGHRRWLLLEAKDEDPLHHTLAGMMTSSVSTTGIDAKGIRKRRRIGVWTALWVPLPSFPMEARTIRLSRLLR